MKSGNQSMYTVLIPAVYWPADRIKVNVFPNGEDFIYRGFNEDNDKLKKRTLDIIWDISTKADYPIDTIFNAIDELYNMEPDFISVTWCGGSTKDKTVEISSYI